VATGFRKNARKIKKLEPRENSMADDKTPSGLAIWLGIADNSFTRQKTVKFGDASAVNSGRAYSIITVLALFALWFLVTNLGWVKPIFWPSLDAAAFRSALPWVCPPSAAACSIRSSNSCGRFRRWR
jgi:hypothetical protein